MAEQGQHDAAAAVKALTVVAVVFLPTTVVLNFFSTSFIDTSGGSMILVDRWWLFLVVGLPLTAFTLLAWWSWMHFRSHTTAREKRLQGDEETALKKELKPPSLTQRD